MQPRIRSLQQNFKGREDRERLNQEMMRLYRQEGINPAGGCLPRLVQLAILVVLCDVIRGLNNTLVTVVRGHPVTAALPRYLPNSSRMYHDLVASHGAMNWLGFNLALGPFSAHAQWFGILPYVALILVATGLQYVQLAQVRKRNPIAAKANPQMEKMQKVLPVLYAFIYCVIPGAVILYTIVSTTIRIATQRLLFRPGEADYPPTVNPGAAM
jgi:YidC/Oxa1 family membrane protein insertase